MIFLGFLFLYLGEIGTVLWYMGVFFLTIELLELLDLLDKGK
jgi:hypothetical protein